MSRLIISGTREELSAEDRAIVLDIIAPYAARASAIGVGDCPTGVDVLVLEAWPFAAYFAADWNWLGNAAGPERNGRMVAWCAETGGVLLAFPGPSSRGTWDCVRQARAEIGRASCRERVWHWVVA